MCTIITFTLLRTHHALYEERTEAHFSKRSSISLMDVAQCQIASCFQLRYPYQELQHARDVLHFGGCSITLGSPKKVSISVWFISPCKTAVCPSTSSGQSRQRGNPGPLYWFSLHAIGLLVPKGHSKPAGQEASQKREEDPSLV